MVDYVLVHELAHLLEPGHTPTFWSWVDGYPKAERAKGFLEGFSARSQQGPSSDEPDWPDEDVAALDDDLVD